MSLLSVRGITKRFGGVVANRDISFEVAPGELVGVIGPNGAGKSTLFEIVTGFQRPDAGEVELDASRLTGLSPDRVCRLGVARTFQKLRPFHGMTVLENVLAGALTRTRDVREGRRQAAEIVERVGLGDKRDAFARTLSTGQRKRLELARALATRPRLLLLDEVTAGVDQRSIPGLVRLVQDLHRSGLTLLVIEHNMRVITAVAQRILALYLGELIADGPTEQVTRDRRVVEAYLGQAYAGSDPSSLATGSPVGSDPSSLADRRAGENDGV
jgi:branched-chain amino acid transport system ATP-binding protein